MSELATIEHEETAPAVQEPVTGMVQMIEKLALSPDVDVTKLEKLLEMQERILDREAKQAFNEALSAAKKVMPQVARDAENKQTGSRYARLETVSDAIDPVIAEHGFALSFGSDVSPLEGHYRVLCELSHAGGHTRNYQVDVPSDQVGLKGNPNKTPTHAFSSTMTYGRRNLKLMIFDVSLKNQDDDGNAAGAGERISEAQMHELTKLAEEVGADKMKFCRYLGIESFADIPAKHFENAKARLEEKRGKS